MMKPLKALKVSGSGDYAALDFELIFDNEPVISVINTLDSEDTKRRIKDHYLIEYGRYDEEDLRLEVIELECTPESFQIIADFIGDYDQQKHYNIYLEGDIIKC
jgi:hypothetical protein